MTDVKITVQQFSGFCDLNDHFSEDLFEFKMASQLQKLYTWLQEVQTTNTLHL